MYISLKKKIKKKGCCLCCSSINYLIPFPVFEVFHKWRFWLKLGGTSSDFWEAFCKVQNIGNQCSVIKDTFVVINLRSCSRPYKLQVHGQHQRDGTFFMCWPGMMFYFYRLYLQSNDTGTANWRTKLNYSTPLFPMLWKKISLPAILSTGTISRNSVCIRL